MYVKPSARYVSMKSSPSGDAVSLPAIHLITSYRPYHRKTRFIIRHIVTWADHSMPGKAAKTQVIPLFD